MEEILIAFFDFLKTAVPFIGITFGTWLGFKMGKGYEVRTIFLNELARLSARLKIYNEHKDTKNEKLKWEEEININIHASKLFYLLNVDEESHKSLILEIKKEIGSNEVGNNLIKIGKKVNVKKLNL